MDIPVMLIEFKVDKYIVGVKFMHTPVVVIGYSLDKLGQS